MANLVMATCSECFMPQLVDLNPRRHEITCLACKHSVPMFERGEMDAIKRSMTTERNKMFFALGFFAGAVFLFALYAYFNSGEDLVVIPVADGEEVGLLVERDDTAVSIRDLDTKAQRRLVYAKALKPSIEQVMKNHPLMTPEQAAQRAAEGCEEHPDVAHITTRPRKPAGMPLLVLAGLAALGAVAFSAIATQDRLVCEF
jgi:hypothetical protein